MQKPKFKPEITRVKLNSEQAVLTCDCYTGFKFVSYAPGAGSPGATWAACVGGKQTATIDAVGNHSVRRDTNEIGLLTYFSASS